jgi:hypothetical protein
MYWSEGYEMGGFRRLDAPMTWLLSLLARFGMLGRGILMID